jgi:hypothetical protein
MEAARSDWPLTLAITRSCVHQQVIAKLTAKTLDGGYTFRDAEAIACDAVAPVAQYTFNGDLATQTGAYIYRFALTDTAPEGVDQTVEALVMATHWNDEGYVVALACIPAAFLPAWTAFTNTCDSLAGALNPAPRVRIIGGSRASFEPKVGWENIILPADLKDELIRDVESFFTKRDPFTAS